MEERDWGPGNPVWEDLEQERKDKESEEDLPLCMRSGWDPETPGREYALRKATYEAQEYLEQERRADGRV